MSRNRKSAKKAGARFERDISDYLAETIDDHIDRKVRTGAKDSGDIANVRTPTGRRVTIECKNTARMELAQWTREADTERVNAGDDIAVVVHKRHGVAAAGSQWVTMTVDEFVKLLGGEIDGDAL